MDYNAGYQTFTADQWSLLESAGAVFMPASGYRRGSNVNYVHHAGSYWSATENGSYNADHFYFHSDKADLINIDRYFGHSVRLVKDL